MRQHFPGGPVFEAVPEPGPITPGQEPVDQQEPVESAWQGPSQEEWQQSQQAQSYIADRLEYLASLGQGGDPNALEIPEGATLLPEDMQVIEQLIQRATAPLSETRDRWMQSEGENLAQDVIADETAQSGDFLLEGSKQKARDLSENYYPQFAQRYGNTAQAAEAAIRQACSDVRDWEQQVGKAFMEREQNQLATLAGAPRSPAQPGRPAAQQLATVDGGNEFDVLRKYFPNT